MNSMGLGVSIRKCFGLILLVVLASGGCNTNLTGTIFLDENADNKKQDEEGTIANLPFTVTKDDEELDLDEEPITDVNGNFEVSLQGSGTYCVEVTSSDLSAVNDDGTSPSIVTSTILKQARASFAAAGIPVLFAETDCEDGTDDDGDGDTDCDDADCDSDDACTSTTETDCEDGTDDDGDGDTDCDDADCDSDDACTDSSDNSTDEESDTAAVTESGLACDESGGFGFELKVPIAKDYSSGIENMEDPSTNSVNRGDTITLEIAYPVSCTFDLIFLPTSITPIGASSDSYEPTTGQFNFNVFLDDVDVEESEGLAVHYDTIGTFDLDIFIDQDGSLDSKTLTITPTVTCPDVSTVTLKTQTIEIDSEDDFEVEQSMSGTADFGNTITVTTTVTNNTSTSFDSDDIELTLVTPSLTSGQTYDASCSNLGESATCSFDINGNETVTFTTTFDLPDEVEDDTTFEMTSTLTVTSEGSTATFEADSITFSLVGDDDA